MQHVSYAYVEKHIAPMYVDVSEIQQVRWCMLNTNNIIFQKSTCLVHDSIRKLIVVCSFSF